jgi:hypothetical protein
MIFGFQFFNFQRHYDIKKFSISVDRRYVLLAHNIRATGTYSYTARYKIFDTISSIVAAVVASDGSLDLQHVGWGPNGNQLVSCLNYNYFNYHFYFINIINLYSIDCNTSQ